MAEPPATQCAGPRSSKCMNSRPNESVAPFPCVYRLGEQTTASMAESSRPNGFRDKDQYSRRGTLCVGSSGKSASQFSSRSQFH